MGSLSNSLVNARNRQIFFFFDKRFSTIIDASRRLSTFYDIIFYIISFFNFMHNFLFYNIFVSFA